MFDVDRIDSFFFLFFACICIFIMDSHFALNWTDFRRKRFYKLIVIVDAIGGISKWIVLFSLFAQRRKLGLDFLLRFPSFGFRNF